MKHALGLVCLCLALLIRPGPVLAAPGLPFAPGEKLFYELYWTVVHAGSATLEVSPAGNWHGTPSLRFQARARSTPFVDTFYKVRTTIESVTQADMRRSLYYRSNQKEGRYRKDAVVEFDWGRCVATRKVQGTVRHSLFLWPAQAHDPLSMLFYFRCAALHEGMIFESPVTDGKKRVIGRAVIGPKELVKTPLGEFEAFRVDIQVSEVGGVFQKSPGSRLRVWISADARHLPVKVQSEVAVGSFTLELVRAEGLRP